ncbi:MAG TPA: bifunctional lysine ketoglutarate reductase /saccharopine dehydrogenase family protein [Thermoanaerobaculia bacterium]|nr:bifunctional lysine ketoglutarate reductase /saccharopine dehydrogenase family protein [Thermoanaerobaculia bacterium]HUM29383.1 bifunctional lysine ketoglutarate reductase /saccharopine dehydrogenase family protein [Thermoanaerobaculia bacterium]HXK67629.1 bifunctional lysine ketoglutarate reductase /saccharopine dehydrogenase family protein [Thermoanaerobaculia bacterium]
MPNIIGIRREDKNQWERRVSLTPDDVAALIQSLDAEFVVQPSPIRIFTDQAYADAGARLSEDLSSCNIVMGVKEMPSEVFLSGKTYIFFSHTIKGQSYNMPMLRKLLQQKCTLIDYEKIEDEQKRRLVFFGIHAGYAGMIDGLWMLGQRLKTEGFSTPFEQIRQAKEYPSLEEAKKAIAAVGQECLATPLPPALTPMVFGFAGYGHVSAGAQEVFDVLPHKVITPSDLLSYGKSGFPDSTLFYKVIFKEEHLVAPLEPDHPFELQEYYDHPERFKGMFHQYLPHLTLLINCIFWTPSYPRLITRQQVRDLYASGQPKFRGVSDISCDPNGSIEFNLHCTDSGNPVYVYLTDEDRVIDGFEGNGPAVLAIDNLPCELPFEASTYFSSVLRDFMPSLIACDFTKPAESLGLPDPLMRALIVHRGEFTAPFRYMKTFIE